MTTHIEHDGRPGRALAPECCVCRVGGSLFALVACCWFTALLLGAGFAQAPASQEMLEGYRAALARAEARTGRPGSGATDLVIAAAPSR